MFENLIEVLKANPRKIVYTEGTDARILESAARLKKDGFLTPVLVGNVEAVKAAAEKGGFDIEGLEILDPATYPGMDEMVKRRGMPCKPAEGQLLRYHAGQDGRCRFPARRCNLFNC